jgi:PPP family 3-phenylpropionic acid transporter
MVFAQFPQTFLIWMLVRFGIGFFISPTIPLADSLIAGMSSRYRLNYGTMRLCGSISFALSAFVCGMLWERVGFKAMFFTVAVSFLPALFFASRLEEIPAVIDDQHVKISFKEIVEDRGLLILLLTSFFIGASINISLTFDSIYMSSLGSVWQPGGNSLRCSIVIVWPAA